MSVLQGSTPRKTPASTHNKEEEASYLRTYPCFDECRSSGEIPSPPSLAPQSQSCRGCKSSRPTACHLVGLPARRRAVYEKKGWSGIYLTTGVISGCRFDEARYWVVRGLPHSLHDQFLYVGPAGIQIHLTGVRVRRSLCSRGINSTHFAAYLHLSFLVLRALEKGAPSQSREI